MTTFNKIPSLDLTKVSRLIAANINENNEMSQTLNPLRIKMNTSLSSNNESCISTAYSSGKKTKNKNIKQHHQRKSTRLKTLPINKSIFKQIQKSDYLTNKPKESNVSSWKEHKVTKGTKLGFKANHWDFTKKRLSLYK